MPKELNLTMAEEIRADLEQSGDLLVVGLLPMGAAANLELRTNLRERGARLRVIHNRASRHALSADTEALGSLFFGQTALALRSAPGTEFIPVAKALWDAAGKRRVELRGGFVDGEILDKGGVESLAMCPDRPTMRAMICGAILGSARGIALALSGVGGGLARCLQARIDKESE